MNCVEQGLSGEQLSARARAGMVAFIALMPCTTFPARAVDLVHDNFTDGNFTGDTVWTIAGTTSGTWSVTNGALELNHPSRLNTFEYHPVPHYIETTFAETVLSSFTLTASVGFHDLQGGDLHNNNALGFALLNAAGTSGYMIEFSSFHTQDSWLGMNIRRMDNGIYTETLDLDGRLVANANGYLSTFDAGGNVVTQILGSEAPADDRYNLTFSRTGDNLQFTLSAANRGAGSMTVFVTDPHPDGALRDVGRLRAYGTDPGYGFQFDDIRLTDADSHSRTGFGKRWLRRNPFQITGAVAGSAAGSMPPFSLNQYMGMNMTAAYANNGLEIAETAADAGVAWHAGVGPLRPYAPFSDDYKVLFNRLISRGHGIAWMLPDEPITEAEFQNLGHSARWFNQNHPEMLVYVTAYGAHNSSVSTLTQLVSTVKPDLLMFDQYPFKSNGTTDANGWFQAVMNVRQVALAHKIPYGGWLQSFQDSGSGLRTSSESDTRYNGFTLLTAGYTMLNYFMYDHGAAGEGSVSTLFSTGGTPTALYNQATAANLEYAHLGKPLRYLVSSDVRFVSGGIGATPTGLTHWSSGAGGDDNIVAIVVSNTTFSSAKDGLIGFFTADDGQRYFMLTNLYHSGTLSASAAAMSMTLTLDDDVEALYRLSRITGAPERVDLNNHALSLTLPGGTGDLFKYDNGFFAGIIPGDADLDDDVDFTDLTILANSYGVASGGAWLTGDFSLDGNIGLVDLTILATYYNRGAAQAIVDFHSLQIVPEAFTSVYTSMTVGGLIVYQRPRRKTIPSFNWRLL